MKINQEGIDLIKSFEGLRLEAYKALPTEKEYTIGYGHYGSDVKKGMVISQARAEELLKKDLERFERYVEATKLVLNENQFSALVSFCYNCGPGNLKKLVSGRALNQIADAMLQFNHAGGKELKGLTRRRKAERELFLKKESEVRDTMDVIIGSARIDENGKAQGGALGDQKQKTNPDYSGEVSMQKFYVHSKGWYILRPKDAEVALRIAASMIDACNNIYIGYDQGNRLAIMTAGTQTKKPTECDCSSLLRKCIVEATGKDPGNFTTGNEITALKNTGLFENKESYKNGTELYTGDVLVTKTKGHTAVVTSGAPRRASNASLYPIYRGSTTSIVKALQEVGEKDTSFAHREKIAVVNSIFDYKGTAAQNTKMLNLLKQGRLIKY